MRRRLVLAALLQQWVLLWVTVAPNTGSAAVIAYDTRAAWEAAVVGPIYTETFDSVPAQRIGAGVGGTIHTPTFDIFLPPGLIEGAFVGDGLHGDGTQGFRGSLHFGSGEYDEFRFASPIYAFALDVNYVEDGFPGILVSIAGEEFRLTEAGSFFGAISDTAFTTVVFRNGGSAPRIYDVDNVSIAPVPEAGSWLLLAVGALALSCRARPVRSSA